MGLFGGLFIIGEEKFFPSKRGGIKLDLRPGEIWQKGGPKLFLGPQLWSARRPVFFAVPKRIGLNLPKGCEG